MLSKTMGLSHATIRVFNKGRSKSKEVSLLVDTGSVYTWINGDALKDLQIIPTGSRKFKTIEGRIIKREIGEAVVEYDKERVTTVVVFGFKEDGEVIGVHALEGLGLEVDPTTKELRKVEAILAI